MQQDNKQTTGKPMVVSIKSEEVGNSTGFFVTENLIATNIHCIAGASSVSMKHINSNTDYDVEGVAAYDAKIDLVILKVAGKATPFPISDGDLIEKGELVKAVGCINGKCVTTEGTFHSTLYNGRWLQTTAKTCDGYSGGPLLNYKGKVIGINFLRGDYYSGAISSIVLNELLTQTHTIEKLTQWKERSPIKAYAYLVDSKKKATNKDYVGAINDLDKTIQLNPDYIVAYENRATAKGELAESKHNEGNSAEVEQLLLDAIDDYTQAITLCPDWTTVYINQGTAKLDLGKSKIKEGDLTKAEQLLMGAIDDFTRIIKFFPDYAIAYNHRADAKLHLAKSDTESGNMAKVQETYKDAMININIAIQQHVHNPIEEDAKTALFHHIRGEIKEAIGDLHGAAEDFKNSIKNTEYTKNSTVSLDLERVKEVLTKQG